MLKRLDPSILETPQRNFRKVGEEWTIEMLAEWSNRLGATSDAIMLKMIIIILINCYTNSHSTKKSQDRTIF